jgi:hypothetical protein
MIAVVVPPAVPLPTILEGPDRGRGVVDPVPIVVVGWVQDETPRYCLPGTATCRGTIVVERVAWAAGEWVAGAFPSAFTARSPSASFSAAIERTHDRGAPVIASREVDRGEPVLSQALLSFDEMRAVDSRAASAIPPDARPTPDQPVWYTRSVGRPSVPQGPRLVAWAVIDRRTGLVLAFGDADGR